MVKLKGATTMAKVTNYSDTRNASIRITFNQSTLTANGVRYQPVVITTSIDALTDEGGVRPIATVTNLGTQTVNPVAPKNLYNALAASTTGQTIADLLKAAYLDAIAVDITV
jgi:hypothetical protein